MAKVEEALKEMRELADEIEAICGNDCPGVAEKAGKWLRQAADAVERIEALEAVLREILEAEYWEHPDHQHRHDCDRYCYIYKIEQVLGA